MTESHPSPAPEPTPAPDNKWDDSEFHPQRRRPWWQQHRGELIGFSVLVLILAAVVLWLPKAVQPPAMAPSVSATDRGQNNGGNSAQQRDPSTAGATGSGAQGPAASPWQDAQQAKARREAQDVLAKLLELQQSLEAMQVQLWAEAEYQQATAEARRGDELYRDRDFMAALSSYHAARTVFEQLLSHGEEVFRQALADGQQAIVAQQPAAAIAAYTLATAIRPDSEEARAGLARAGVQEEVIAHLEAAGQQIRLQQWQQAKTHLDQALALDPQAQAVKDKLAEVQQAISDEQFASVMGQGYGLLQQQQYSQAIARFRQALALKPDAAAARDGIAQATHLHTQTRIQQALQQAAIYEQQEQWQQALELYQGAQHLDASVVAARVGVLRTQARAQLDQQLQQLLDQPLRLSDSGVYRSAQQLLADAAQVKPRGPRIDRQQQQLQQALSQALDPVAVLLRSDNKTEVTLYRVGSLGSFREHSMELKPGHYTLVGSRNGYRDVRTEFTLQPGADRQTIVIQCDEKIALGG